MWILVTKLNPQLCRELCVVLTCPAFSCLQTHCWIFLCWLKSCIFHASVLAGQLLGTISNRFQCESSPVSWDSLHQCLKATLIWSYTSRGEGIGFQEQDCSKSSGQQEHQQAAWLPYEQICICALKPGADHAWQTARRWHTPSVWHPAAGTQVCNPLQAVAVWFRDTQSQRARWACLLDHLHVRFELWGKYKDIKHL